MLFNLIAECEDSYTKREKITFSPATRISGAHSLEECLDLCVKSSHEDLRGLICYGINFNSGILRCEAQTM